jgi:hypothetical protein
MKVVVNNCFGGFSLSRTAMQLYAAKTGVADDPRQNSRDIPRHDPALVEVVEELGPVANGLFAQLAIVEIPDGIEYIIDDYDGMETVAEQHRRWWPER